LCLDAAASTETASELLERAAEPASASDQPVPFDGRAFRRSLGKTGRYTRNPRNDKESLALMDEHGVGYSLTGLIAQMRDTDKTWQQVGRWCSIASLVDLYGSCTRMRTVLHVAEGIHGLS